MYTLRFDVIDIFKANRLAFSLQRIWIQFIGFVIGYLGYLIFTYIAIIISGFRFYDVWQQAGFLPCLSTFGGNSISWTIFLVGVLIFVISHFIASTAVTRATYMLLKGNHFYTWREAYAFAFRKALSVIFTPVSIGVIILLFIVGGLMVGALGRIPVIGELGFSLFYLIWIFIGLMLFYFIIVFLISMIISPAIISTTDDDAFEGVFQSFSLVWNQPVRFIFYELIIAVCAFIGVLVFATLIKQGFLLTDSIFSLSMGDKYISLMKQGMYILSGWVATTIGWIEILFGDYNTYFYFSREFIQLDVPIILHISSYIFAVMLLFVGIAVLSYGLAALNTGNTLLFIILRKMKDDYNLLERKDAEEDDDIEEDFQEENDGDLKKTDDDDTKENNNLKQN